MRLQPTVALAVALATAACLSLDRPPARKRRFLLRADRGEVAAAAADRHLAVTPFTVAPAFAGVGFVSIDPSGEADADFYHEFFVDPGAMLAAATRQWLADSGLFATVHFAGSVLPPTHVLEVDLVELAERLDGDHARARLQLQAVALEAATRRVVWHGDLTADQPVAGHGPEHSVAAWNECLRRVLAELEASLRRALAG